MRFWKYKAADRLPTILAMSKFSRRVKLNKFISYNNFPYKKLYKLYFATDVMNQMFLGPTTFIMEFSAKTGHS